MKGTKESIRIFYKEEIDRNRKVCEDFSKFLMEGDLSNEEIYPLSIFFIRARKNPEFDMYMEMKWSDPIPSREKALDEFSISHVNLFSNSVNGIHSTSFGLSVSDSVGHLRDIVSSGQYAVIPKNVFAEITLIVSRDSRNSPLSPLFKGVNRETFGLSRIYCELVGFDYE